MHGKVSILSIVCTCMYAYVHVCMYVCMYVMYLVELHSAPHGLGQALSQRPHLLGQPPRLLLKVLGNVLSSGLQLLLIELLGQGLSVVCHLHTRCHVT